MLFYEVTEGRSIDLYAGSQLLTSYHFDDQYLKSYFHPVNTPEGYPLTLNQPYDHPWHHGLYFTWKYINGVNFWEDNGLAQKTGRMTTVEEPEVRMEAGACIIRQRLCWEVLTGEKLMNEERVIMVHEPDQDGAYRIDFDLHFQASEQTLQFDRTSPQDFPWGGYAGLSFRPVRSFAGGSIMNSGAGHDVGSTHGQAAKWCDFSGRLDGGKDLSGGAAIFDHPENPRHPAPYYVFDTDQLQFLQSALLFNQPYILEASTSLRLQYGVYIHRGFASKEQLEHAYQQYTNNKPVQE